MELLWLIFTFIMVRIVASYSKSNFVSNFFSDIIIQLLHIITFVFLIIALLSSQSILYRLTVLYPSYHLISCVYELILDILYAFGFYEDSDNDSNDEDNNTENVDNINEKEK